jgi:phytol kinase
MSLGVQKTRSPVRKSQRDGRVLESAVSSQGQRGRTSAVIHSAHVLRSLTERLTVHEWRRRLVHMAPGLLPLILVNIPHLDPLQWPAKSAIAAVVIAMSIFALRRHTLFARRDELETGWISSVVSYAGIALGFYLGLPSQPELGMAVTMIIAFGDGSATLMGLMAPSQPLPWNHKKSWAGFAAFMLCSIPLATLIYWAESRPGVSFPVALACVAPAAALAALAESLPMRLNDNLRVGVTAGLTILATHGMFVGW